MKFILNCLLLQFALAGFFSTTAQTTTVGQGWAGNSVNAVIFRKNSICSWKGQQLIAYYDQDKNVVLGKRKLGDSKWVNKLTPFKGNATDAHRSIRLMTDGEGYLHVSTETAVVQLDLERKATTEPTPVQVLEYQFINKNHTKTK